MSNLLRYNNKAKYIFYDFECCSLNLWDIHNKPWQLGLLEVEGEKVIKEHNFYIWWEDLRISKEAAQVTRFNYDLYKQKAQDANKVLDVFDSFLYNPEYLIVGHNQLNFDVYIHKIFRRNLNKNSDYSYINRCIDTNALAKGIKKNFKFNRERDNLLAYQYRMLNWVERGLKTNLTLLGKENNIEFDYDSLHSGINDVFLMRLIWDKWIKWGVDI